MFSLQLHALRQIIESGNTGVHLGTDRIVEIAIVKSLGGGPPDGKKLVKRS